MKKGLVKKGLKKKVLLRFFLTVLAGAILGGLIVGIGGGGWQGVIWGAVLAAPGGVLGCVIEILLHRRRERNAQRSSAMVSS